MRPACTHPAAASRPPRCGPPITFLLAHGLAGAALRAAGTPAEVASTLNLFPVHAASEDPADADAARRLERMQNRIFLDPVLRGSYPGDILDDLTSLGYDLDRPTG